MPPEYDAVVVGSGPNGLAAAITLAEQGCSVLVLEAHAQTGGGTRTAELTLPGFLHDVCSAVHPMAVASPLFERLDLPKRGVTWIHPPILLAHPLENGQVALLYHSLADTANGLGRDAGSYRRHLEPWVNQANLLLPELLQPIRLPRHPWMLAQFGLAAMRSARALSSDWFTTAEARALFAGCAAHCFLPLDVAFSSAIGLALIIAGHANGWPMAKGGSATITQALVTHLKCLGGVIEVNRRVERWGDIPAARAVLFDTSPKTLLSVCADRLPSSYHEQLSAFRAAPGIFKIDWALSDPIPWTAPECARAGTVHLGGTLADIELAEARVNHGQHPERPFVLLAQQSLFDATRAPQGRHTGWAYCHVPHGSTRDMTDAIERQVERYAPGFRDCIVARHHMTTIDLFQYNANYEGGDITGGANDFRQMVFRPTANYRSYATPCKGIYLCSSSTPPGGGVHGMCGYNAARLALRQVFGKSL
jgi:phytoene dehydrogenase-like protein